ncbi:MAG: tetratricopeptide repeat protein [Pseudomonadota bacterium]
MQILGDCTLRCRAGPIALKSVKSFAMFAALCLAPSARLTRAWLTDLLWENAKDANAAFRQALKALRDSLKQHGSDVLIEPQGALQLAPDAVVLDSILLLRRLAAGEVPEALLSHAPSETMLQGLDGLSEPFDQFLRQERERFRGRLIDGLRRILEAEPPTSPKRGDAARALLITEPTDEYGVRSLMDWLWRRGEPTAATKVYADFCQTLDDLDADLEPSRATLELLRDIKLELDDLGAEPAPANGLPAEASRAADGAADGIANGAAPRRPTIVVRPFTGLGSDRHVSELATGLTFDLITRLSRFSTLDVIWRDSSYILDAGADDLASASAVGAKYVASGVLRADRDRLIVTVTLSDGEQRRVLWAQKFDQKRDALFAIETEIEETAASAMAINISLAERSAARRRDPSSLDAYALVVNGRLEDFEDGANGRHATARAMRSFNAAIAHDPNYAAALAGLARAHAVQWRFGWTHDRQRSFDAAMASALRAVEADPNDASAHAELGFVNLYAREHDRALASYERALELNPSNCEIIAGYADALSHNGEPDKALPLFQRALKLNPLKPDLYLSDLAGTYFVMHEFEKAIETIRTMRQPLTAQRCLTAALMLCGREEEGRREATRLKEMFPGFDADAWLSVVPDRLPEHSRLFKLGLKRAGLGGTPRPAGVSPRPPRASAGGPSSARPRATAWRQARSNRIRAPAGPARPRPLRCPASTSRCGGGRSRTAPRRRDRCAGAG